MTTGTRTQGTVQGSHEHINQLRAAQIEQERRRRWRIRVVSIVATVAVIGVVVAMMLSSRQQSSAITKVAPDFTLTNTSGDAVNLASFRGSDVLLYFSEGAGCQACLVQMAQIEQDPRFAAAGLTVLPIVMNTREEITTDMATNGVLTPFLVDDGSVSTAYGTIGKGMHANLPGHSFVLIDKAGNQRWYGEYPSMWLSTDDLLQEVSSHLAS